MAAERILVVEDDKHISKLIKYNLEKAGFSCTVTVTAEEALDILDKEPVDLAVVDIMLPKMDGLELCKSLKQDQATNSLPVIILTARGEEVDRVVGFELGADDYIVKPFSPRELVLRIRAILRRGRKKEIPKEILRVGTLTVDIPRHKVVCQTRPIELSPLEFKLLMVLMERKGRVQSRETLLNDVWGFTAEVTTRTVDTHIKLLRKKLGKAGSLIETVHGIGYKISDEE